MDRCPVRIFQSLPDEVQEVLRSFLIEQIHDLEDLAEPIIYEINWMVPEAIPALQEISDLSGYVTRFVP